MVVSCKKSVVIIDTGCANLNSVKFALKQLDINPLISDKADEIQMADRVILPGVGSAQTAMTSIYAKGLTSVIQTLTQPVLGICLGMQILTKSSSEGERQTQCLGVIDTDIHLLRSDGLPLPHMGWNTITPCEHPLFQGIHHTDYFYFVHSFCAPTSSYTLANTKYGQTFSSAIAQNNFIGVQFHPEKSAIVGEKMLKNFVEMPDDYSCY